MFEHESEGFQFTFSAWTTESFTEPNTPPQGRSLSFERVVTPRNTSSQSSSPGSVITPPITNCSSPSPSSSYIPLPELESDFDNNSAPPSPTPQSKNSLPIPLLAWLSDDKPVAPTIFLPTVKALYKECIPSISRAAASIKRTFSERKTSTPLVSPEKKKVSAICTALERSPKGLMRFLKKCTPAEHDQQIQRTAEEENE